MGNVSYAWDWANIQDANNNVYLSGQYPSSIISSGGAANVSVGYSANYQNTSGNNNVAIGSLALGSNTTGNNNTAIGQYALGNMGAGLVAFAALGLFSPKQDVL